MVPPARPSHRGAVRLIRDGALADLPVELAYRLLALRVDVFVVEQRCAYPELDGRDLEPGARHLWIAEDERVVACLRLLDDGAARRIGRVAVAADRRGRGLGADLVRRALELAAPPVVLDAQAHLASMYERLGFVVDGEEFVEDGIPHVPMRHA